MYLYNKYTVTKIHLKFIFLGYKRGTKNIRFYVKYTKALTTLTGYQPLHGRYLF